MSNYDAHKCMVLATDISDLQPRDFRILWAWLASSVELSTGATEPTSFLLPTAGCEKLIARFVSLSPWEQQNVLYLLIPRVEESAAAAARAAARVARRVDAQR